MRRSRGGGATSAAIRTSRRDEHTQSEPIGHKLTCAASGPARRSQCQWERRRYLIFHSVGTIMISYLNVLAILVLVMFPGILPAQYTCHAAATVSAQTRTTETIGPSNEVQGDKALASKEIGFRVLTGPAKDYIFRSSSEQQVQQKHTTTTTTTRKGTNKSATSSRRSRRRRRRRNSCSKYVRRKHCRHCRKVSRKRFKSWMCYRRGTSRRARARCATDWFASCRRNRLQRRCGARVAATCKEPRFTSSGRSTPTSVDGQNGLCEDLPLQTLYEEFTIRLSVPCDEEVIERSSDLDRALSEHFADEERCIFASPDEDECGSRDILFARVDSVEVVADTCDEDVVPNRRRLGAPNEDEHNKDPAKATSRELKRKKRRRRLRLKGKKRSSGKCRRACAARRAVKASDVISTPATSPTNINPNRRILEILQGKKRALQDFTDPSCVQDPPDLQKTLEVEAKIIVEEAEVVKIALAECPGDRCNDGSHECCGTEGCSCSLEQITEENCLIGTNTTRLAGTSEDVYETCFLSATGDLRGRNICCEASYDGCDAICSIASTGQTPPPTVMPSRTPTSSRPTRSPSTDRPTVGQTSPPTVMPSRAPTSSRPTRSPSTDRPTRAPTSSQPTRSPTSEPPTASPSLLPTGAPQSMQPTASPTASPSFVPTASPSPLPTRECDVALDIGLAYDPDDNDISVALVVTNVCDAPVTFTELNLTTCIDCFIGNQTAGDCSETTIIDTFAGLNGNSAQLDRDGTAGLLLNAALVQNGTATCRYFTSFVYEAEYLYEKGGVAEMRSFNGTANHFIWWPESF